VSSTSASTASASTTSASATSASAASAGTTSTSVPGDGGPGVTPAGVLLARIERLLLDLGVVATIGLGALITANIVGRTFFGTGVPDTIVMARELMVAAIVLPLAAATGARAHIVVEFLSRRLPESLQSWLVVAGSAFGLCALAPLIWAGFREAMHTLGNGAFFFGQLNLPKWPGRVIFLFGMSFCWLRLLLMTIGDVRAIRAGRGVQSVAGRPARGAPAVAPDERGAR